MRGKTTTGIFFLILIIAILHLGGIYLHLYWRLFWFDWIVHVLGGIWISITTLFLSIQKSRGSLFRNMAIGIMAAVLIGIGWEIFEVRVGAALPYDPLYPLDTATDLGLDIVGGIIGSLLFSWKRQKQF